MAAVAANGISSENQFIHCQPTACNQETEYRSDVRKLVDLLSKLNPLAKEFFPSSYPATGTKLDGRLSADAPIFVGSTDCYNRINVPENGNGNKDSCSDVSSNNQLLNRRVRLISLYLPAPTFIIVIYQLKNLIYDKSNILWKFGVICD